VHEVPLDVSAVADCVVTEAVDDVGGDAQVGVGELVELGPALGDVVAALLDDGVEPGADEERLGAVHVAALADEFWRPVLVGALEVLFDAWRGLVGDLETEREI